MNTELFKHPVILKALKYDLDACFDLLKMYEAEKERPRSQVEKFYELYGSEEQIKDEIRALEAAIKELEGSHEHTQRNGS